MTLQLEVLLAGRPVGQGSMRAFAAGRMAHPETTLNHRNLLVAELREAWRERAPLLGPVQVDVLALFPRPQSHTGTGRNAGVLKPGAPYWVVVPVDLDKIVRLVCDALVAAGVVVDDAQVARIKAAKRYATPGDVGATLVAVRTLDDEG